MATGHAGDHERERKRAPEERHVEIDLGRIDVRQRVVDDVDVVPAGGRSRLDIGFGGELQMLALAPCDVLRFAHWYTLSRTPLPPLAHGTRCRRGRVARAISLRCARRAWVRRAAGRQGCPRGGTAAP